MEIKLWPRRQIRKIPLKPLDVFESTTTTKKSPFPKRVFNPADGFYSFFLKASSVPEENGVRTAIIGAEGLERRKGHSEKAVPVGGYVSWLSG